MCSLGCLLQLATVSRAQTAESATPLIVVHREQSKPVKPQVADGPEARDYTTRRYEPAGFPLLGGDSDIGFEFGVVGTLSRFGDGVKPYQWNMDLVLALSVKNSPTGNELTQQSYQWNVDVPNLDGGRIRINPQLMYYRTVNQLYFGLGNASRGRLPTGTTLRHFEFDDRQARLRVLTRFKLLGPLSFMLGDNYRFEDPHPYAGSRLQSDAATGVIRGVRPLHLFTQALGLVFDSRDNEIFPHSGIYGDIGVRTTVGAPVDEGVHYGGAGMRIAKYTSLGGPAILATRGVVDLEYGKVPVYDLYTGGVFSADEMVGGCSRRTGAIHYVRLVASHIVPVVWRGRDQCLHGFARFEWTQPRPASGMNVVLHVGSRVVAERLEHRSCWLRAVHVGRTQSKANYFDFGQLGHAPGDVVESLFRVK